MTTAPVEIRSARRSDLPSLTMLWVAMLEENGRVDPRLEVHPEVRASQATHLAERLEDPGSVFVVAEEPSGVIVGAAGGQMSRRDGLRASRVRATLVGCFVVPPRRRLGIARRLATRVADALIERGADELKLNVVSSNAASRAFWASLGYRPVEELLDRRTRGDS